MYSITKPKISLMAVNLMKKQCNAIRFWQKDNPKLDSKIFVHLFWKKFKNYDFKVWKLTTSFTTWNTTIFDVPPRWMQFLLVTFTSQNRTEIKSVSFDKQKLLLIPLFLWKNSSLFCPNAENFQLFRRSIEISSYHSLLKKKKKENGQKWTAFGIDAGATHTHTRAHQVGNFHA